MSQTREDYEKKKKNQEKREKRENLLKWGVIGAGIFGLAGTILKGKGKKNK